MRFAFTVEDVCVRACVCVCVCASQVGTTLSQASKQAGRQASIDPDWGGVEEGGFSVLVGPNRYATHGKGTLLGRTPNSVGLILSPGQVALLACLLACFSVCSCLPIIHLQPEINVLFVLLQKTGARIKIFSNCCPQSTDRVCQISGRTSTCVDSIREIMELIKTVSILIQINSVLKKTEASVDRVRVFITVLRVPSATTTTYHLPPTTNHHLYHVNSTTPNPYPYIP